MYLLWGFVWAVVSSGAGELVLGSRHWTHGAFEGASGGFGAFGALYGAFGGFGALTLIFVLAIWERCWGRLWR